jgi:hypothetical protein
MKTVRFSTLSENLFIIASLKSDRQCFLARYYSIKPLICALAAFVARRRYAAEGIAAVSTGGAA